MLRKCLVALMMGVICAENAVAESPAPKGSKAPSTGVVGWFKSRTSGTKSATASRKTPTKAIPSGTSGKSIVSSKSRAGGSTASRSAASEKNATASVPRLPFIRKSDSAAAATRPGIERAVVKDAERQDVQVRQTAAAPDDAAPVDVTLMPSETALQPVPIEQAPGLPNVDTLTGPQYFSATSTAMSNPVPVHPSNNWQQYQAPQPIQNVSQGQYWNASDYNAIGPAYNGACMINGQAGMYSQMGAGVYPNASGVYPQGFGGSYPQTGAALYPAPRPGIPHQIGGIAIPNQALHPHEMLHAHRYRAIYPPYYYKVHGDWAVTPFGVWSREDWKLQGTQVDVKYHSHISHFTLFKPPVIR